MLQVYQAENLVDAQLVLDGLVDAGLDAEIHSSYLSGAIGELPVDATPTVWILDDRDRARARATIAALLAARHNNSSDWSCRGCGESCDDGFQFCWNCGEARV